MTTEELFLDVRVHILIAAVGGFRHRVVGASVGAEVPDGDADSHPGCGRVPVRGGAAVAGRPGPGCVPGAGRRRVGGAAALMPARHRRGVAVLTGRAVGQHRLDTAGDLHRGVAVVRGGGPGPGLVRRHAGDARRRGVIGMAFEEYLQRLHLLLEMGCVASN